MSLPRIQIVDVQNKNEVVELEELTQTGLGALIYECEQLLEEIKDLEANVDD